jgi:uncharacterized protein
MSVETRAVYFDKPGDRNTDEVLRLARLRADELGLKTVVVASVRGGTAVKAMDVFRGLKVVVVTAHTGWYHQPNTQHFAEENREIVTARGGIMLTAPHVFGGLSYALRDHFGISTLGVDMGFALRVFGSGMKVVIEIVMAAADAGLVRTDEEVISIAGSDRGADTAAIMKPVHVQDFFSLRVKEIICKPRF